MKPNNYQVLSLSLSLSFNISQKSSLRGDDYNYCDFSLQIGFAHLGHCEIIEREEGSRPH